jgi:hypothetical protein
MVGRHLRAGRADGGMTGGKRATGIGGGMRTAAGLGGGFFNSPAGAFGDEIVCHLDAGTALFGRDGDDNVGFLVAKVDGVDDDFHGGCHHVVAFLEVLDDGGLHGIFALGRLGAARQEQYGQECWENKAERHDFNSSIARGYLLWMRTRKFPGAGGRILADVNS